MAQTAWKEERHELVDSRQAVTDETLESLVCV